MVWILRGMSPPLHLKAQHTSLAIRVSPHSHLVFMSVLESVLVKQDARREAYGGEVSGWS